MTKITAGVLMVMAAYLVFMVLVGVYYSKHNSDTSDFYLGGRKLGPLVTAMSQIPLRIHVAQHLAYNVALALTRLRTNDCAVTAGYVRCVIGRVVVIDPDRGARKFSPEVIHDLPYSLRLVVAGDKDSNVLKTLAHVRHLATPSAIGCQHATLMSSCVAPHDSRRPISERDVTPALPTDVCLLAGRCAVDRKSVV